MKEGEAADDAESEREGEGGEQEGGDVGAELPPLALRHVNQLPLGARLQPHLGKMHFQRCFKGFGIGKPHIQESA